MSERAQTKHEEIANAITHGAGILFCLISMPFLLTHALAHESMPTFWAVLVFGIGMLMVFTSSTLYHAVQHQKYKDWLQTADHISIYYLIAGTYTPLVVKFLPVQDATIFLSVMWGLVVFGTIFKLFFTKRFDFVSTSIYLIMGWMIVFIAKPVLQNVPTALMWWVAIGGISYTAGVYFYAKGRIKYFHSVWHCFVLFGAISHYVFVYKSIEMLN